MERRRPSFDGFLDPLHEGLGAGQPFVGSSLRILPAPRRGARPRPAVLIGLETRRQRRQPQLEHDLVGCRRDLVGTGEGAASPRPVALPESEFGLPRGAHPDGVVVGAEAGVELGQQCFGGGDPALADEQVEPGELDGEGEVGVDVAGQQTGADVVRLGPPPQRQQGQRRVDR